MTRFPWCAAVALSFLAFPTRAAEIIPLGKTLKLSGVYAEADGNPVYDLIPITVECRAKLDRKTGVNTILSNGLRISIRHWEIFSAKDTGHFAAFISGAEPQTIESPVDVADGKWHYLAMQFDGKTVKLFVDGAEAASKTIKPKQSFADVSALTFGYSPDLGASAGDVELDEVRISHALRKIEGVPADPYKMDAQTVGLWHFDDPNPDAGFEDLSQIHNPVRISPLPPPGGDPSGVNTPKTRWSDMDYGPFFSSILNSPFPKGNATHKSIAIHVTDREGKFQPAAVCFDTDLCRISVGWTGDFIKLDPTREGLVRPHSIGGTPVFGTTPGPGWARPGTEDFTDPRKDKLGPLPRDWCKYRGLYLYGNDVVLSYTVGSTEILEAWDVEQYRLEDGPLLVMKRDLNVGASQLPLSLRIASAPGQKEVVDAGDGFISVGDGDTRVYIALTGESADHKHPGSLSFKNGDVIATFQPNDGGYAARVLLLRCDEANFKRYKFALRKKESMVQDQDRPQSLRGYTHGGPPRYPQVLETKGTLGTEKGPYQVDTLTPPDDNPWKSFLRFSGFDFFANGDIAVCSISGDVWRVSGVDANLDHLKWRRFATGLHQPLGLKVVDDTVYVLGRDQITRLHDLNNDGEADFYECFNNDCKVTNQGHAFAANLERDPQGNFYYTKGADGSEHGGTVLKVSPDGSKLEVFAKGIRFSNGLGMGPHGELTEADNEGNWVPTSRIDLVKPDTFLGYVPSAHQDIAPTDPGRPICWMPKNVDNSSGSQFWVTSDKWGPFAGQLFHTSYGQGTVLHVMTEVVNDQLQGGVYKMPLNFASGTMRGRFNPADGQLYICGLRGWQTRGSRAAALQRVRYTGKPVEMPAELHVHANGVRLSFTCPLDPASVDADAFSVLQWNYRWQSSYGSRHWSVDHPDQQGFDTVDVKSAKLLPDGKTVFLEIPSIRRVMQMQISFNLKAKETGAAIKGDVYNTIHELGAKFQP